MNKLYMAYMFSEKMSKSTIRSYTTDIKGCLEFIDKPESEIKYSDLINWKVSIIDLASATVTRKVASVRSYFGYLADDGIIDSNPAEKLRGVDVQNKEKTALTPTQVRAMINCADRIRSKAIIAMLASTGMRVSELIGLTIEQYQDNPISIVGKGNKRRDIFLTDETREIVDLYLETRGESEYANVFLSNGRKPMQTNNISLMLKNTAKKAGVENWNEISNHWLRTTAATMQSDAGQPIEVIKEMLGHASIRTTIRYVKVDNSRVEAAMTKQLF